MNKNKNTGKKKMRDLTPKKDAKGGVRSKAVANRPTKGISGTLPPIPVTDKDPYTASTQ